MARIGWRMSDQLRRFSTPEDIWQDTLLQAWRSRNEHKWSGIRPFRAWLMSIAENRIRDAVDRATATKRGGGEPPVSLDDTETRGQQGPVPSPLVSTTPSRIASHRERTEQMLIALGGLPEEYALVVRFRIFEEMELATIAARIGTSLSAVRYRLRKGAEQYNRLLSRQDR